MKVQYLEKFYIAGLSTQTNSENEQDENSAKIPALWQEYMDKNIEGKTFNKAKSMAIYGLYSNYESQNTGAYTYTIGIEVTKPKNAITLEKQRYLVFNKKGELPDVVAEAWDEVYAYFESKECEYQRAFAMDFEKYSKENEIEIYISIA